ncbi:MAG: hypothetical protein CMJ31_12690, partial [Phycisphaerae bacterium]|nr:hypothetical protein [Phycisphaerae bacterium]
NLGGRAKRRFFSTFVIWPRGAEPATEGGPRQAVGAAVFDTSAPTVSLGADRVAFTATAETEGVFWSDTGTVEEVYASWKKARDEMGFLGVRPREEWFDLGWESWDALRWDTNARTVRETIQTWLDLGFPIRWAVTGSGFWPEGHTTTSFGMWHPEKYPDPQATREWFDEKGIAWLLGGRTNFVLNPTEPPQGMAEHLQWRYTLPRGPFTDEAQEAGLFFEAEPGKLYEVYSNAFPRANCAMLDGRMAEASSWFADRWGEWGVDGIKEDTMMPLTDAVIYNGPMRALAERGQLVMARNAAYTSPGTLARIEDMQFIDAICERVARNFQQLAASAAPNVYVDTVGFNGVDDNPLGSLRHAWFSSLTAGMAVGDLPETWTEDQVDALRASVEFHLAIAPTLYDAAVDSHESGYPYTMTPLPIAFPHDEEIARLATVAESTLKHQWMVGGSILAAPLAHPDYRTSETRDVYLPAGRWFDLATGDALEGPDLFTDRLAPIDAPPAFVGGHGVVLTRGDDGELLCCVFPTIADGEPRKVTFAIPGGETVTVTAPVIADVDAWPRPTVTERSSGGVVDTVDAPWPNGVAFPVHPGGQYEISID